MKFEVYFKTKDGYEKRHIEPPKDADWSFFKSLRMTIDNELDSVREDIISCYPKSQQNNISMPFPTHEDRNIRERLNILVGIRTVNTQTKEIITDMLSSEEFITCESCGGKMYKIPINVHYERFGRKYIIKDVKAHQTIEYIYGCEDCVLAESEHAHLYKVRMGKLREELINKGEKYVPGRFGSWSWIDNEGENPSTNVISEECDHAWKRVFEDVVVAGQKYPFIKITEICVKCNAEVKIK